MQPGYVNNPHAANLLARQREQDLKLKRVLMETAKSRQQKGPDSGQP